jgi:hypothetical protein
VISPEDHADVLVTVAHPWADVETTLEEWIRRGPGPRRLVQITAARRRSTGAAVPMSDIPLEYHNSRRARALQRQGLLPCPWGPPPDEPDAPPRPADIADRLSDAQEPPSDDGAHGSRPPERPSG